MICFVCGQSGVTMERAGEVYSHESCMCETCFTEYLSWSWKQGVNPMTGEFESAE